MQTLTLENKKLQIISIINDIENIEVLNKIENTLILNEKYNNVLLTTKEKQLIDEGLNDLAEGKLLSNKEVVKEFFTNYPNL